MPEPLPAAVHADARFELAPGVMLQEAPDGAILLNLEKESMYSLNATGARALSLVVEGLAFESIVDRLAAEYHASASEVGQAIADLFNALVATGLLVNGAAR